jgi:hypothetical protein
MRVHSGTRFSVSARRNVSVPSVHAQPDAVAASEAAASFAGSSRVAASSQQWMRSGALRFPGILWASGDNRLLDLRGLRRAKQQKRERISRPQVVVPVKQRKPKFEINQDQAELKLETTHAAVAADAVEACVYKPVEEIIETVDCEEQPTITIYIVMHNGKRVRAPFKRSDTLQHLQDYVAAHTPQAGAVFSLWGGRPRALLTDMGQLLAAGNLLQAPVQQRVPNAVLQAALRRVVARARYFQRLETEASVMKLSATESRLRRLTEEMRNHSTVMQEAHELEVAEEERQQRLLAVVEEAMAQKKRRERRMSRASASSGNTKSSNERVDDEFSEDWDSNASDGQPAGDADAESPDSPMRSSVVADSLADTCQARAKQLPLSPVALRRLHAQVAGLDLLSPLRRRVNTKMGASVMGAADASPSSQAMSSPSSSQMPSRLTEQSPRALLRASAVSDAERLKRMWNERKCAASRAPAQLSAQGSPKRLHSLKSFARVNSEVTSTVATSAATVEHIIPSAAALDVSTTSHAQGLPADEDPLSRFSYRASFEHRSEAQRSRRRLHW